MQSFGDKCSFRHNLIHVSNQKTSFKKVVQFSSLVNICSHLVTNVHFVSTLTMLQIKKVFLQKVVSLVHRLRKYHQNIITMQSFGHKCSFCHILNYASNQKTSFTKLVKFGSLKKEISSELNNMQSFGHKCSFRHNLNSASNQKIKTLISSQPENKKKIFATLLHTFVLVFLQIGILSYVGPKFKTNFRYWRTKRWSML
jgi:hypothetical protein